MYVKKDKKYTAFVSKHNSNYKEQIILLIIPNEERCHCLAGKKLSALLWGIASKYHGDFYCLNNIDSFETENKRDSPKKLYENEDIFNVIMGFEDTKILGFNQY